MKNDKKLITLGIMIVIIVSIIIIGITYAFFSANVIGNDKAEPTVIDTAYLRLVFNDTQFLRLENALPGASASKTFTVTNNSSIKIKYDINIIDVYNTFQNDELVYSLTSTNNGASVIEEVLPIIDEVLVGKIEVEPGVTQVYTITIKFKETGEDQNYNQGAEFRGKLQINTSTAYSEDVTFEIESSTGEVYKGSSKEVNILGTYYGEVSCESENINIAECSAEQSKIIVEGKSRGITDLLVREDIKNLEVMYSVRVLEPSLGLTETVGEVILSKTKNVDITGEDYGILSCETNNAGIATCNISGNSLNITGTGVGTTTIKVKESNKNLEVNYTITVKDVTLGLSPTSGTVVRTKTINSTISGNNYGTLSCSTSNANIATCSITGTTLTVTGVDTGNTTITVKESTLNKTVNYSITVIDVTLGLSVTSGNTIVNGVLNSTISGSNYGTLTCTVTNTLLATCSISGTTLTITGKNIGTTTVVVKESNLNKTVTYTVTVMPTLYDKILSDNTALSDASLNFATVNGNGFYYTNNTAYGEENTRIYYYRGRVDNNWVSFGGFLWRIVRTTSEGGVKLAYAGNGTSNGSIGYNDFNPYSNSKYYVGYTYNLSGYSGTQTDSKAKAAVDAWYNTNLSSNASYLSTTAIYCADRSAETLISSYIVYPARARIFTNKRPSYACASANQSRYTASTSTGNGYLSKPIALLSVDEVSYAGIAWELKNLNSYIMDDIGGGWTMSPFALDSSGAGMFVVNSGWGIQAWNVGAGDMNSYPVRPAISFKSCVKALSGNGTKTSPYTVSNVGC